MLKGRGRIAEFLGNKISWYWGINMQRLWNGCLGENNHCTIKEMLRNWMGMIYLLGFPGLSFHSACENEKSLRIEYIGSTFFHLTFISLFLMSTESAENRKSDAKAVEVLRRKIWIRIERAFFVCKDLKRNIEDGDWKGAKLQISYCQSLGRLIVERTNHHERGAKALRKKA